MILSSKPQISMISWSIPFQVLLFGESKSRCITILSVSIISFTTCIEEISLIIMLLCLLLGWIGYIIIVSLSLVIQNNLTSIIRGIISLDPCPIGFRVLYHSFFLMPCSVLDLLRSPDKYHLYCGIL